MSTRRLVKDDWYPFCRIMLEWLNPKRDLDPEPWVKEVIARAQSLNVDTLAFDFYHGGYAIFDGAVAPKDRHVGDADLLALLDQELHQRNMRLVAMNMGSHCASYMAKEYPYWRVRDEDGQFKPFFPAYHMCLNTPYANFLLQELTEFLPRYQIDGLYIEGLYGLDCYCDYCCTEFERTYGCRIPRDKEKRQRCLEYRQFRADVITNFVRRLRKVIGQVSPHTVLMPCPSMFENVYADFHAWGTYADAITLERQWGYQRDKGNLFEVGLSMQVIRAESSRPPFGTLFLAWGVDHNYAPSTSEHYRLNFTEILLYGGTPQLHAQTIFENDQLEMPTVREMFDLEEQVRPTLLDAHLVHYAALVVDWTDFNVSEHFKGFYQALIENHVPFEVISKHDLRAKELDRFEVILLPNVFRLNDEEVAAIKAFNAAGGGVVMTYRTGCSQADGSPRPGSALVSIAGIRGPFGVVTNPASLGAGHLAVTYYKVLKEHSIGKGTMNRLQSFAGSYAEVELTTGMAIAQALDYDYSKMHRHHPVMGWYPGHPIAPLIIVNEAPSCGRVVYFAAEFDRATYNVGMRGTLNTLTEATIWAAKSNPPIEVKSSPTVEVATHFSPSRNAYTILMINKTTNDLRPGIVVRHVEPVRDSKITLRKLPAGVRNVRSVTDAELNWEATNNNCVIKIPQLKEYEGLIVELEEL